jgi:putative membrane-bound dehydrogenase-like protein
MTTQGHRHVRIAALLAIASSVALRGADVPRSNSTYAEKYGATNNPADIDPARDLPRYPAVEPKDALATWRVKPGFKLEFAAHEPQVRDPVAICFDENGRMFVCEMIDYPESRDVSPHLGRITMLEDKDGDGYYETSTVFADDLPWPTGLIWANGGLFVAATPDIWRIEDRNGDGRADFREKVFTGFGTGLKLLNVQGLINHFQWGPDNRIHVDCGAGNRGEITSPKRPELAALETGGRDFWFDPRTYAYGIEEGGEQFGMSFDDYGRKFGSSNSDHLQFWVYDEKESGRNPFFTMPPARQSIAADGAAAEVYRISPDEPWRIARTRWRVGGVVSGPIEGGGRVSGYFTGASGTLVYRGDAYGPEFVNNTFTGEVAGNLFHRKQIFPDGASLVGRRPTGEEHVEFAASTDTWVRPASFANAPDGCLYICDMYREIVEHPWSIPEEIKHHLDLNSGNDRGRIYRLVRDDPAWQRRTTVALGRAPTAELVRTLEHRNGWHRDTATRLLYERQDAAAVPLLVGVVKESSVAVAKLHALQALQGLNAIDEDTLVAALADRDEHVRERAAGLAEDWCGQHGADARLAEALGRLVNDPAPRVRLQLAFTLEAALGSRTAGGTTTSGAASPANVAAALVALARRDSADPWISSAILGAPPAQIRDVLFTPLTSDTGEPKPADEFIAHLIEIRAAAEPGDNTALIDFVANHAAKPTWLQALGDGLRRGGTTLEQADRQHRLRPVFTRAASVAPDRRAPLPARLDAIEVLGFTSPRDSTPPLVACLEPGDADAVQTAAIRTLARTVAPDISRVLIGHWPSYTTAARQAVLAAFITRDDRSLELLNAIQAGRIKPGELSATDVQGLIRRKSPEVAGLARTVLASVIPPSRAEVAAKFQPAVALAGDASRGHLHYARCMPCHRAANEGFAVGPDLLTVKNKGRDGILTAITDPNKEVASQFIAYTIATNDGQTLVGIITRDDATTVTIKMPGAAEVTIPRANIKSTTSSGHSLMPEGIEAGMSVQDMADLLTFIEQLK